MDVLRRHPIHNDDSRQGDIPGCAYACSHTHAAPASSPCILPRLRLVAEMIDAAIAILRTDVRYIGKSNRQAASLGGDAIPPSFQSVDAEHMLVAMHGALCSARLRIDSVGSMPSISGLLLPVLYLTRVAGARLNVHAPRCSRVLSDASIHLGSIIADSAIMSGSYIDTACSNADAMLLLDQAKLTADSKIKNQYPKLAIPRGHDRCY